MYVNNTNIFLLIYNVYIYDYSFGENKKIKNKLNIYTNTTCSYIKGFVNITA